MQDNKNVVTEGLGVREVQEESYKSGSVQYIDSREVARLVEKEHNHLRRDIRKYTSHLDASNFGHISEFWMESSYIDTSGRTQKCYLITEKGCEFIAHKLTGQKGTEFTARYINRFHEMKGEIAGGSGSVDVLADTMKEYMLYQEKRNEEQMKANQQQAEFNKMVMEFMSKTMQRKTPIISSVNPFDSNESVVKKRMETLNDLVDEVAELCSLDRNKVLHYMYQRIQESENVNLKSYLNVFRTEMKDNEICTFQVVCSVDRLFDKAIEMNKDVIERKRIYG